MNTHAQNYLKEAGELPTDSVLTQSETVIASGYVCGMSGKEIADLNCISVNTVVKHTQNIYEKTGIRHSPNALVSWFLSENGRIDLAEFRRRAGAALLLCLVGVQLFTTDFGSQFVRARRVRQAEVRNTSGGRGRRDECGTFNIS